jgi:hypothetical protein
MKRRISTALVGLAAIAALVAVPSALASYTSTRLEIQQVGTKLTARISANPNDDPTASAIVLAPAGTQLTTNQAPGTVLGPVDAFATVLALGGANVELKGHIVVAAPGQVPAAQSAPCLQGAPPLATWLMVIDATTGQEITVPLYLVSTAGGPFAAVGPAYVQVCLPAPDIPENQGGAPLGVKLYAATLTISGVFGPVPAGAWISLWVPYTPRTGKPNPAGEVAAPAAVAPGGVTLKAKKLGLGAVVSGQVTQATQPRGGAVVTVFGGPTTRSLKKLGSVKATASGNYAFRARTGVFYRATAVAASASAPTLCAALAAQLPPGLPCVNPTLNGFTASSKAAKKK